MMLNPTKVLKYNHRKFINDDGYGQFVFKHAEEWANLMEQDIKHLNKDDLVEYMKDSAENVSFETECCKNGLTGFQHDCATGLLIDCWYYGYELYIGLIWSRIDNGFHLDDKKQRDLQEYLEKRGK